MKTLDPSPLLLMCMLALIPLGMSAAWAADSAAKQKTLSSADVDHISERIRQTGDQMRADLKKARARFEAQEVERKQAAERARVQAIKDREQRQAQLAAEKRQQQLAAQAKAERERQEAAQAKLQAERKKPVALATPTPAVQAPKNTADDLQARKLRAAEALKKMRASSEPKAF